MRSAVRLGGLLTAILFGEVVARRLEGDSEAAFDRG